MHFPIIRKANLVVGNALRFRNADTTDAEFIFSLRTDENISRHLTAVSSQLSDQLEWLTRYEQRDNEAYFIIESTSGEPLGTVRLYDSLPRVFAGVAG